MRPRPPAYPTFPSLRSTGTERGMCCAPSYPSLLGCATWSGNFLMLKGADLVGVLHDYRDSCGFHRGEVCSQCRTAGRPHHPFGGSLFLKLADDDM